MIVLFTDFGLNGPYTGQMKAVIHNLAPSVPIVDLLSDAPAYNPQLSAYLLAAYYSSMPSHSVFLTIVDPGVGGIRKALVVKVGNRHFVGPDNGLFEMIVRRTKEEVSCWEIVWQPDDLSASFHGRDLFAPVAAAITMDSGVLEDESRFSSLEVSTIRHPEWPNDLTKIVYIDQYGNALTGIRSSQMDTIGLIDCNGTKIPESRTFSDVGQGELLYYGNSNGLVEIAVNQGRAVDHLDINVGQKIKIIQCDECH